MIHDAPGVDVGPQPVGERARAFLERAGQTAPRERRRRARPRARARPARRSARARCPTSSSRRRSRRSRAPAPRRPPTHTGKPWPAAARTASCSAVTRSTIVPNSSPNASFSARLCESPAPIAAISRPPLTRCAVANALASVAGGRSVARATSVPTCTRSVSAATAPSNAKHSSAGRRLGGSPRHRWSYTNTPSSPAASAACATAIGISGSSTNDGSVSPSWTRHARQAPGQHGRADRAGALAELRGHDRDRPAGSSTPSM